MITLRVCFVMAAVGILFAGGRAWPAVATSAQGFPLSVVSTTVHEQSATAAAAEPHRDVRGNTIDDAVGDYRIDLNGEVYERHFPQIDVSRLRPPVS